MFSGVIMPALLWLLGVCVTVDSNFLPSFLGVFLLSVVVVMAAGRHIHVGEAGMVAVSTRAFPVTGKLWCFCLKFLLPVVCFTSEIAKMWEVPQIQSLFLGIIDVGLTRLSRISELAYALQLSSTRNKLQKALLKDSWLLRYRILRFV